MLTLNNDKTAPVIDQDLLCLSLVSAMAIGVEIFKLKRTVLTPCLSKE
jgi:hypothetical protein